MLEVDQLIDLEIAAREILDRLRAEAVEEEESSEVVCGAVLRVMRK